MINMNLVTELSHTPIDETFLLRHPGDDVLCDMQLQCIEMCLFVVTKAFIKEHGTDYLLKKSRFDIAALII